MRRQPSCRSRSQSSGGSCEEFANATSPARSDEVIPGPSAAREPGIHEPGAQAYVPRTARREAPGVIRGPERTTTTFVRSLQTRSFHGVVLREVTPGSRIFARVPALARPGNAEWVRL